MRDFAAHFLFENGRYSTKIHDLVAHFFFESKRFSTKIRDLARITFVDIGMTRGFHRIKRGCVRTAGAAGALRAGSVAGLFWVCKTRHVVLVLTDFDEKLSEFHGNVQKCQNSLKISKKVQHFEIFL